ncbi:hypothetical protein EAE96_006089 [Botrytis aclada]|nr:hypothetical protein EAE96_006089 [Botrytis aclada]
MSQSSTRVIATLSSSQIQMRSNRTTMQNIPQEFCRCFGNSFEIYSAEAKSNITALIFHIRSRQWANADNNVARLLRKNGHRGSNSQVKSLYFDPRCDRIRPINETQWTREAVEFLSWVMKAIGVERIAVSDCSHTLGIDNNAREPWASFYWWSNIENWSSTFTDTLMYTTKINLDVHQKNEICRLEWSCSHSGPSPKRIREGQRLKARLATRKLQVAGKRVGLSRTKQDGVPTWRFKVGHARRDFNLIPMVEVGSLDRAG